MWNDSVQYWVRQIEVQSAEVLHSQMQSKPRAYVESSHDGNVNGNANEMVDANGIVTALIVQPKSVAEHSSKAEAEPKNYYYRTTTGSSAAAPR